MRRLLSLCLVLSVGLFAACGKDDKEKTGEKSGKDGEDGKPETLESLFDEVIKLHNDEAEILEGIKSKSDAEAAKGKLETIRKKLRDTEPRGEKLMKDKNKEEVLKDLDPTGKLEAAFDRTSKARKALPFDAFEVLNPKK